MSRFPHLPETFILREMNALRELGGDVLLYPLMHQAGDLVHEQARAWTADAVYLSSPRRAFTASAAAVARRPLRCLGVLLAVLKGCLREPGVLVRSLTLLPACLHLAERVRRDGVEHVHAHYATYPLLAAWVAHRLTGVPYSVTVHAHDLFVSQAMLAVKLREAAFVAAISDYNRRFLVDGVDARLAQRTHVVHCGIEPSRYASPPRRRTVGRLDLLCVGSLQTYKGQLHLVEACRLLVERGIDLRCRIVGGGPQRDLLQRAIDAGGLQSRVELVGPRTQDEVARLLASADCYVQPSIVAPDGQMEGIPVSIMEAMAAGLPVVATELSGVPELVRDGETGWLVPPADAAALADALQDVALEPARAERLAAAGRALVAEEFDLRRNAATLAALLSASGDGR